jgi:hypothetical protein
VVKDYPARFRGDMWSNMSSFPAISGFLDQDYYYKSVATHTPHDAELAPICHAED